MSQNYKIQWVLSLMRTYEYRQEDFGREEREERAVLSCGR